MGLNQPPIRRWFPIVFAHSLLTHGFTVAFRPALAYALIAADAPVWMLNVVAASFALPALVLALPVGRFVDVFGERIVAILSAVLLLSGTLVALFGYHSPGLLLIACLLAGAGHLPSVLVDQSQVANFTPAKRLDAMYGYYGLSASIGQLLGPLLLALPGGTDSLPPLGPVFLACTLIATALAVTAFLTISSHSRGGEDVSSADGGTIHQVASLLRTPGVTRSLLVGAVPVAVLDISHVYWPALGVERGYDVVFVSMLLSLRAVASMGSRLFLGRFVDRWGRPPVLVTSLLGTGIAALMMAVPLPLWLIVVGAVAFGFALGVAQPLSMSWLASLTPSHNRGVSVSLRLGVNRAAQIGTPLVLGGLVAVTGTWAVIAATGVMMIATAAGVKAPPPSDGTS
jgi:MFS family permease